MSNYTLTIQQILHEDINIFDSDYGINELHKARFEENFINYYMFSEIGFETCGRFIFELNSKLKLITPYYNKLYETVDLIKVDDILHNYDLKEESTREINGLNKFSDTPQGEISNLENYLTQANENTAIEKFTTNRVGNIGVQTASDILRGYREELINIDKMLIDELRNLFMMIY